MLRRRIKKAKPGNPRQPGLRFSLNALGIVAAAVLSRLGFSGSAAGDGGSYIWGAQAASLHSLPACGRHDLVAGVAVAVAGGRTLGLGMGPDGVGGGVGAACNFASRNLFRCCAS
jgi:hypothetical protein